MEKTFQEVFTKIDHNFNKAAKIYQNRLIQMNTNRF